MFAQYINNGHVSLNTNYTAARRCVMTVMKRFSHGTLKELMFIHNRRHRKSRDQERIGQLFGRDLDQICCRGKLSPPLAVSTCRPICTCG